MHNRVVQIIAVFALSGIVPAQALEPLKAAKGARVFAHDFSTGLPDKWNVQFGEWKAQNGVLRARQIPTDNHGAAARRVLEMKDGIFELRFRLVGEGRGFHFGFDPKRGSLKKKGHLFSVMVSPMQVKLTKHVDKARPREDPNDDLAKAAHGFAPGDWHTLLVEKQGNDVVVQIRTEGTDKTIVLNATHPSFHVPTPTLVFRCQGDGVEVDDVKVWTVK